MHYNHRSEASKARQQLLGPQQVSFTWRSHSSLRRWIILAMSVTAIVIRSGLLTFGVASIAKGAQMITTQSPLPWLQVIQSSAPEFSAKVSKMLGSTVSAATSSVLPYSVVITNNGAEPLVGIAVRFSIKSGPRTVNKDFFYLSFAKPGQPLLSPGQSILITPLKMANALVGGAPLGQGGGGTPPLSSSSEQTKLQQLSSSDALAISVDLAIAANGSAAGPDLAKTLKRLTQQRDAYRDMRSECMARLAPGISDESIRAWLKPLSEQKLFRDPETLWGHEYTATQINLARHWLSYLNAGRRADLAAELSARPPEISHAFINTIRGGLQ